MCHVQPIWTMYNRIKMNGTATLHMLPMAPAYAAVLFAAVLFAAWRPLVSILACMSMHQATQPSSTALQAPTPRINAH